MWNISTFLLGKNNSFLPERTDVISLPCTEFICYSEGRAKKAVLNPG